MSEESASALRVATSRRHVLGGMLAVTGMTVLYPGQILAGGKKVMGEKSGHGDIGLWLAKQQILELRQLYGFATDLIGTAEKAKVEEGRAIYRSIFTADASIGAATVESVTGPDAWVDIVLEALEPYEVTQHLIGTQRVTVHTLPDSQGRGGRATMQSYLQAWHEKADGELWLFFGTYNDEAVYSPEHGWQISNMMLEQTTGERRTVKS